MGARVYDLEQRTFIFARNCRFFIRQLPSSIAVYEDAKQLVRSSGSVGANYIEANESLSKKDFYYRLKVCRKEAKESIYWLSLLREMNVDFTFTINALIMEADELKKIFSSIIEKAKDVNS